MTKQINRSIWLVGLMMLSFSAMAQTTSTKENGHGNIRMPNGVWVNPGLFQCNYGTAYAVSSTVPCENNPLLKVK